MDKKKLNNEIILCRPAVRKARVSVIRKILKKIKILKSCKNEALKEKKSRKSCRLFEKVQIIKKLKDDDVTKFALRINDLNEFLSESNLNLKDNALVCLAKHKAVIKRVEYIRSITPDWKNELPLLLDLLGKKKIRKDKLKIRTNNCEKDNLSSKNRPKSKGIKNDNALRDKKANLSGDNDKINAKTNKKKTKIMVNTIQNFENELASNMLENSVPKEEKVQDPFFIEKKVSLPKLFIQISKERNEEKVKKMEIPRKNYSKAKPIKNKNDFIQYLDSDKNHELHPSWAAKKVSFFKPFEGKKIKFTED